MSAEERLKHLEEVVKGLTGEDTNVLYEQWKAANQGHQHWDGTQYVCDPGYERGADGICALVPEPTPTPTPTPPPAAGVLYDSNTDIDWASLNGQKKTVNKFGNVGPNGKGFYTAASGSPKVEMDPTDKSLTLITQPGSGRFYTCVNNYNATLEYEFNIHSGSVDNLSEKTRSRHQMGGACDNRFGGLGAHVALSGEVGFKAEKCHNIQAGGKKFQLPKKIQTGTWYKSKYEYKDTTGVQDHIIHTTQTRWIDYNDGKGWTEVAKFVDVKPFPAALVKAMFDKQSEYWLRLNGSGSISFKNIKLTAI